MPISIDPIMLMLILIILLVVFVPPKSKFPFRRR
jgi:hypothetical protein